MVDGLTSNEYSPIALRAYEASILLSKASFQNFDFDESGHAIRVSATYSDENDAPVLQMNDVTFSDSKVAAVASQFMTVNATNVLLDSFGYREIHGPRPVFNLLGGTLDLDGLTFIDVTGEINLIGRASDNSVKNVYIEGGQQNLVVMGLTKKEIKDEIEYENQSMIVTFVEGLGNVDLTNLTVTNTIQSEDGIEFRGVTADQVLVHSTILERSGSVLSMQNSHVSHAAIVNNDVNSRDDHFRQVVNIVGGTLENFIIAGVDQGPDNQYGLSIGCDSTAAYGIIYDIQTKSGYDGGGVTHECPRAS